MQINLEILRCVCVEDNEKCDALNEKIIVSDMLLRRRLTRNARIVLYLNDQIGEKQSPVVIGNAYGEVHETFAILKSIAAQETVSPTQFQNSVHNTPASYLSIVGQNKGYITTVSDLHNTSEAVLKVGAVKSLNMELMVLIVTDAIDFLHLDELNRCGITKKECGVALLVRYTTKSSTITLANKQYDGYSPSVWKMLEISEKLGDATGIITIDV